MGCGSEIVNSVIERSRISAAVHNAKTFLNYYKGAVRSGLYSQSQAIDGLLPYYNKVKEVEHLANKYQALWGEKYSKIKLQLEKFIN